MWNDKSGQRPHRRNKIVDLADQAWKSAGILVRKDATTSADTIKAPLSGPRSTMMKIPRKVLLVVLIFFSLGLWSGWTIRSGIRVLRGADPNLHAKALVGVADEERSEAQLEARKKRIKLGVARARSELFVCRHISAATCDTRGLSKNLHATLAAGAKMTREILGGLGGGVASVVALICFTMGLRVPRRGRQFEDDRVQNTAPDSLSETAKSAKKTAPFLADRALAWWSGDIEGHNSATLTFCHPTVTFKLFLLALLLAELNYTIASNQAILAAPELIWFERGVPINRKRTMPPLATWCMPGLVEETADAWVLWLQIVRAMLLMSWFTFLALPRNGRAARLASGPCYSIGAVLYVYLGTITLAYCQNHSTQGMMLFVFSAALAVPSLEYNPRSAAWLRKFLYFGILIPTYLFSGIAKFRYKGVLPNITGSWVRPMAFSDTRKYMSALPSLFEFMRRRQWSMAFVSWGNLVVELVLPVAVLLRADACPLRDLFHFSEYAFHITIFFLMGPNFTHYALLHFLALDPLRFLTLHRPTGEKASKSSLVTTASEVQTRARVTGGDWLRVGFGTLIILGWFRVQFLSDISHLLGYTKRNQMKNPYFPIPECSMFARPKNSEEPAYSVSLFMVTISFVTFGMNMFGVPSCLRTKWVDTIRAGKTMMRRRR